MQRTWFKCITLLLGCAAPLTATFAADTAPLETASRIKINQTDAWQLPDLEQVDWFAEPTTSQFDADIIFQLEDDKVVAESTLNLLRKNPRGKIWIQLAKNNHYRVLYGDLNDLAQAHNIRWSLVGHGNVAEFSHDKNPRFMVRRLKNFYQNFLQPVGSAPPNLIRMVGCQLLEADGRGGFAYDFFTEVIRTWRDDIQVHAYAEGLQVGKNGRKFSIITDSAGHDLFYRQQHKWQLRYDTAQQSIFSRPSIHPEYNLPIGIQFKGTDEIVDFTTANYPTPNSNATYDNVGYHMDEPVTIKVNFDTPGQEHVAVIETKQPFADEGAQIADDIINNLIDRDAAGYSDVNEAINDVVDEASVRKPTWLTKLGRTLYGIDVSMALWNMSLSLQHQDHRLANQTYHQQIALLSGLEAASASGLLFTDLLLSSSTNPALVAAELVILGTFVATQQGLTWRRDNMTQAADTQLYLTHLYQHYQRAIRDPQLLTQRQGGLLAVQSHPELMVDHVDLRQADNPQPAVAKGALWLSKKQQAFSISGFVFDVLERRYGELVQVDQVWRETDARAGWLPMHPTLPHQHPFVELNPDAPSVTTSSPVAPVHTLFLPVKARYSVPWERHGIPTKHKGIYTTGAQLGAPLAAALEPALFNDAVKDKAKHLTKLFLAQQQPISTDIRVDLPARPLRLILPTPATAANDLGLLRYQLHAPADADMGQVYSIISPTFFGLPDFLDSSLSAVLHQPTDTEVLWTLHSPHADNLWLLDLTQASNTLTLTVTDHTLVITDTKRHNQWRLLLVGAGRVLIARAKQQNFLAFNADEAVWIDDNNTQQNWLNQGKAAAVHWQPTSSLATDKDVQDATAAAERPLKMYLANASKESLSVQVHTTAGVQTEHQLTGKITSVLTLPLLAAVDKILILDEGETINTLDQIQLRNYLDQTSKMLCVQVDQSQRVLPFDCRRHQPRHAQLEPLYPGAPYQQRVFKRVHPNTDYWPIHVNNESGKTLYVNLRYHYQGRSHQLAIDTPIEAHQSVRPIDARAHPTQYQQTSGSHVTWWIPKDAVLESFVLYRLTDDGQRVVEDTTLPEQLNEAIYFTLEKHFWNRQVFVKSRQRPEYYQVHRRAIRRQLGYH
ncbi:MAG: hypothetical protein ISP86_01835 [Shewanellaceae bacterium]|nr:hypothetical protein [Shewanellaceae bacterium]